jgi:hypothetical protein
MRDVPDVEVTKKKANVHLSEGLTGCVSVERTVCAKSVA